MAVTLEQVKRLIISAETKGVDSVLDELSRMRAGMTTTGQATEALVNKFNHQERSLFPLIRAQQQLEQATRIAATMVLQDAAKIDRASQIVVAAQQRYAEAAIKAKTAGQAQAEASERQRKAFIEEGRAIRQAAEAQEFYNKSLGVRQASSGAASSSASVFSAAFEKQDARQAADERIVNAAIAARLATEKQTAAVEEQRQAYIREGVAIRAVTDAQALYNFKSGISPDSPRKSAAESASVFQDKFDREEGAVKEAARLSAIRSRYDDAYKAGQNYAKAVREINELHKAGNISSETRVALLKREQSEYRRIIEQEVGGGRERGLSSQPGSRLALHQARNLGFQVNDILTGAFSGQSPMMILAQQGGQVYQILSDGPGGVGGAMKRLGGYMKDLLTPMRLVTMGFVGIGIAALMAINDAQNRLVMLAQSLNGLGAASGLNARGLNSIASRAASSSSTISISQAQQQAAAFARTGMSAEGISGLTGDAVERFSKSFGVPMEEATKSLAAAFADPAKGAKDLGRVFGTISDAQMESIRRTQELGDTQRAQKMLLEALNGALKTVTPEVSTLGHASEMLKKQFSDLWTRFGESAAGGVAKMLGFKDPQQEERELRAAVAKGRELGLDNGEDSWLQKKLGIGMVAEHQANVAKLAEIDKKAGEQKIADEAKQAEVLKIQRANAAAAFIREITPWEEKRLELVKRMTSISGADSGSMDGGSAARSADALERYNNQLRMNLPPMQQMLLTSALQVQQTLAMTLTQRAAVDAQRAYNDALRNGNNNVEALKAGELAFNQARADGLRILLDASRDAKNRLELSTLLPGERDKAQLEQQIKELGRQSLVVGEFNKNFEPFRAGIENGTNAVTKFAEALTGATATLTGGGTKVSSAGIPSDDQWRAQVKYSERAGSTWNPAPGTPGNEPINPFGRGPTSLSANDMWLKQLIDSRGISTAANNNVPPVAQARQITVPATAAAQLFKSTSGDLRNALQEEKYTQVVREANQQIEFQNKLLQVQMENYGRSTAEVAEATKRQELLNAAQRTGLDLTPNVINGINETAAAFGRSAANAELFAQSVQRINELRSGISDAFSAFTGGLARGQGLAKSLKSAVDSLVQSLLKMGNNLLMQGLFGDKNNSGGLFSSLLGKLLPRLGGGSGGGDNWSLPGTGTGWVTASAQGNIFHNGSLVPFARGGIVRSSTLFPMANGGVGQMGEAGPEAIMPLRRGRDGKLGVAGAGGGGGVSIVVNNNSAAKVDARSERGMDGREMIELIVNDVKSEFARGGFDGVQRGRFGVSPQRVMR